MIGSDGKLAVLREGAVCGFELGLLGLRLKKSLTSLHSTCSLHLGRGSGKRGVLSATRGSGCGGSDGATHALQVQWNLHFFTCGAVFAGLVLDFWCSV